MRQDRKVLIEASGVLSSALCTTSHNPTDPPNYSQTTQKPIIFIHSSHQLRNKVSCAAEYFVAIRCYIDGGGSHGSGMNIPYVDEFILPLSAE